MDMTKAIILEENINDNLWPKLALIMTYVKNNRPIKVLQNLSFYKTYTYKFFNLSKLQIIDSTIYIFLYNREINIEVEKMCTKSFEKTIGWL